MKYGKAFDDLLALPNYEGWRESSIQYKSLKKIISRITDELEALGLNADVLKEILDSGSSKPGASKGKGKAVDRDTPRFKGRAEYKLGGTAEQPAPKIRLVFSSESETASDSDVDTRLESDAAFLKRVLHRTPPESSASSNCISEVSDEASETEEVVDSGFEGTQPSASNSPKALSPEAEATSVLMDVMYGKGISSPSYASPPGTPRLHRRTSSRATITDTLAPLTLPNTFVPLTDDQDADDESLAPSPPTLKPPSVRTSKRRRRHRPRREIDIALTNDSEFFTLLGSAISSLQELETAEKTSFADSVAKLASQISKVASPTASKSDMYAWREIFSTWVEAQIFESDRERDRGERSVEDAEDRLLWFVEQVGRKDQAIKMRNKRSKEELAKFVELNETLLNLKKFSKANEEAARKILKKHDKRTALTATADFPLFISRFYGDLPDQASTQHLILPGLPSLPHILLATFTDTLLPILPQLEDYSCVLCSDVAFKPIRLECGHRFCIRCLVKMQKRGQDHCPCCRANVVTKADGSNLDKTLMKFLKLYFPREVKEKMRLNAHEATREELEEMGLNPEARCIVS